MISVIVPVYNVEKYLTKCIDSIIAQTYKDIELILVDDGSPDDCPKICDEYAEKDSRIRVIHKENGGVSTARNVGLKIARGEYIGFVDPDDYIDEAMYENMLSAMETTNSDMAICGYEYVNENNEIDKNRTYVVAPNEILDRKKLFEEYTNMPPTVRHGVVNKLFKKCILKDLLFPEEIHSAEDVLFLLKYSVQIKQAVFVRKPLYYNLVREGSATHGGLCTEQLKASFFVHEKMYLDTVDLYPDLKAKSIAFLLDVLLLKYNEGKNKLQTVREKSSLILMKKMIRKYGRKALFNKKIYWKTRLMYLFVR